MSINTQLNISEISGYPGLDLLVSEVNKLVSLPDIYTAWNRLSKVHRRRSTISLNSSVLIQICVQDY
ncbi:MAG: hypothetical protein E2O57_01355 [Gammaproteobacteria bacterium]|nr:MAG: hypothetical protein E2O57_01355 [Gammaproteobacteria bacterium]